MTLTGWLVLGLSALVLVGLAVAYARHTERRSWTDRESSEIGHRPAKTIGGQHMGRSFSMGLIEEVKPEGAGPGQGGDFGPTEPSGSGRT